jgi:hypothetical protein
MHEQNHVNAQNRLPCAHLHLLHIVIQKASHTCKEGTLDFCHHETLILLEIPNKYIIVIQHFNLP